MLKEIAIQLRDIQYPERAREEFEKTPKDVWDNTSSGHQDRLLNNTREFISAVKCAGYKIVPDVREMSSEIPSSSSPNVHQATKIGENK